MSIKEFARRLRAGFFNEQSRATDLEDLASQLKQLQEQVARLENLLDVNHKESAETDSETQGADTEPVQAVKKPVRPAVEKSPEVLAAERAFQAVQEAVRAERDAAADAPKDELTRIKGIGPAIEKKLHGIGIIQFAQIAEWTNEDISAIAGQLKLKGRIEREEWVRQAQEFLQ